MLFRSGLGLNLYRNKLKGNFLIFAAGTGIVPVFDLICLTLRYVAYKISREKYGINDNLLLLGEDKFFNENIAQDYCLSLYLTYKNLSSSIALDFLKEFQEINKIYKLNIFKLYLRFSNEDKWDENFLIEKIEGSTAVIEKVYIIGPSGFCRDLREGLKCHKVHINQENIIIV